MARTTEEDVDMNNLSLISCERTTKKKQVLGSTHEQDAISCKVVDKDGNTDVIDVSGINLWGIHKVEWKAREGELTASSLDKYIRCNYRYGKLLCREKEEQQ